VRRSADLVFFVFPGVRVPYIHSFRAHSEIASYQSDSQDTNVNVNVNAMKLSAIIALLAATVTLAAPAVVCQIRCMIMQTLIRCNRSV
jgi:hypothetical protein